MVNRAPVHEVVGLLGQVVPDFVRQAISDRRYLVDYGRCGPHRLAQENAVRTDLLLLLEKR